MNRRSVLLLGSAALAAATIPLPTNAGTRTPVELVKETFQIFDAMWVTQPEREIMLGFLPPESLATDAWCYGYLITFEGRTMARVIQQDRDILNRIALIREMKDHLDNLFGPDKLDNQNPHTWGLNKVFRDRTMRELMAGRYEDLALVVQLLHDARRDGVYHRGEPWKRWT